MDHLCALHAFTSLHPGNMNNGRLLPPHTYLVVICLLCLLCCGRSQPYGKLPQRSVPLWQQSPSLCEDIQHSSPSGIGPEADMTRPQARGMLTIVAGLYGVDYSLAKLLQERMPPEVVSFMKYGLAALYFLPQLAIGAVGQREVRVGLELGVWCSIYAVSVANAIHTTQASKVSFISSLAIILPPIYDMIADNVYGTKKRGETIAQQGSHVLGLVRGLLASPFIAPLLAMQGVHLLSRPGSASGERHSAVSDTVKSPVWRDALLLVSPVASSLCYWRTQRLAEEAPYRPTAATTVMLGTVAALTLVVSVFKYGLPVRLVTEAAGWLVRTASGGGIGESVGHSPFQTVAAQVPTAAMLAVSSLLVTGWNTVTEQRALGVVSAAEAYLVLSLEPFFATLFAALLLGERVDLNTAYAALFMVAASLWGYVATWLQDNIVSECSPTSKCVERWSRLF